MEQEIKRGMKALCHSRSHKKSKSRNELESANRLKLALQIAQYRRSRVPVPKSIPKVRKFFREEVQDPFICN